MYNTDRQHHVPSASSRNLHLLHSMCIDDARVRLSIHAPPLRLVRSTNLRAVRCEHHIIATVFTSSANPAAAARVAEGSRCSCVAGEPPTEHKGQRRRQHCSGMGQCRVCVARCQPARPPNDPSAVAAAGLSYHRQPNQRHAGVQVSGRPLAGHD